MKLREKTTWFVAGYGTVVLVEGLLVSGLVTGSAMADNAADPDPFPLESKLKNA